MAHHNQDFCNLGPTSLGEHRACPLCCDFLSLSDAVSISTTHLIPPQPEWINVPQSDTSFTPLAKAANRHLRVAHMKRWGQSQCWGLGAVKQRKWREATPCSCTSSGLNYQDQLAKPCICEINIQQTGSVPTTEISLGTLGQVHTEIGPSQGLNFPDSVHIKCKGQPRGTGGPPEQVRMDCVSLKGQGCWQLRPEENIVIIFVCLFVSFCFADIYFLFIYLFYNIVVGFAIHWYESAMDLHVFPILKPPHISLPIPSLWVFPVHQPWAPCLIHQTWTGALFHIW